MARVEISNEMYHLHPAVSKSRLDVFARSPRHYWLQFENPDAPVVVEESEALIIGAASHCAVLEPDLFNQRYVAVPKDAPRRPTDAQWKADKPSSKSQADMNWWLDFNDKHQGRIQLPHDDYRYVLQLRDAVWADKKIADILNDCTGFEQSFFGYDPETGLEVRCRTDCINVPDCVSVDLKFVRDASPWGFGRACAQHRYDVQAAFYPHVLALADRIDIETFGFIAVEKYDYGPVVALYFADAEMMASGRAKFRGELDRMAMCKRDNYWPGYTEQPQPVLFPNYAKDVEQ